ncbi:MAG: hypothetical protein MRJ68_00700 [Nitrospira sp.]|nr:hypothetical protein [Nitrospira sp.]
MSHSGASAAGEFLHTLDAGYSHRLGRAAGGHGKGQHGILQALTTIARQLPFAVRGGARLDASSSTGIWWRSGASRAIQFTRSRPYKKDDNA